MSSLGLEAESQTLTLIDWGLADDLSSGLARAGRLYLDQNDQPPMKDGHEVTQEQVEETILAHRCQVARFYRDMSDFRQRELLCQGYTAKTPFGPMVFVEAPGATIILNKDDGDVEPELHGKFYARNLSLDEALDPLKFLKRPLIMRSWRPWGRPSLARRASAPRGSIPWCS